MSIHSFHLGMGQVPDSYNQVQVTRLLQARPYLPVLGKLANKI